MEIPRLPAPPVMLLNVPVIWTPPADWVKVRVPAMPPLLLTIWQAALQSPVILRMNIKLLLATIEGIMVFCSSVLVRAESCGRAVEGNFSFRVLFFRLLIAFRMPKKIEIDFEMLKNNMIRTIPCRPSEP